MSHADTLAHIEKANTLIAGLDMNANFADLLRQKAEANKQSLAVHFFQSDEKLTYAEIDEQTDRLADALMQMGVRKGTHVALVTPNSSGFVLSWFAIAKIGAVMVPVNPTYTVREMTYVLADSDASYVIYDPMFGAVVDAVKDDSVNIVEERMIVLGDGGQGTPLLMCWRAGRHRLCRLCRFMPLICCPFNIHPAPRVCRKGVCKVRIIGCGFLWLLRIFNC